MNSNTRIHRPSPSTPLLENMTLQNERLLFR